jgi:hypothetical protein
MKMLSLCCLLFILSSLPANSAEASKILNKKFLYHLYWSGIKAGEAVLEFKNTPEGVTIKTHAKSAAIISFFYKVDDVAQSVLYQNGYPNNYAIKIHEGRTRKDKTVYFTSVSEDSSQKITYRNKLENETEEFYPEKPAYDPLSAFYEMISRNLQVGRSEYIDIFDNKKLMNTEVAVLRKERISVPAGDFDTLVVKPLLKTEGIFLKKGAMHIWVTDDNRKIPVLFKSKVKIGNFSAKLMKEYE